MGNSQSVEKSFAEIEEEFKLNPLQADLVIEAALTENRTDEQGQVSAGKIGSEQCLQILIPLPSHIDETFSTGSGKTHVILVADRSGSMSGNPWTRVKQAMLDIVETGMNNSEIKIDIVLYDHEAVRLDFTFHNYKTVIEALKIGGTTSFVAAFNEVDEIIAESRGDAAGHTVIIFLTDGNDTVTGRDHVQAESDKWTDKLRQTDTDVSIHTVGFSRSHDFKFLQKLSESGSTPGMFRYCEPQDGPTALQAKLAELFNLVSFSQGQTVDIEIVMDGENKIVGLGKVTQNATITGEITEQEQEEGTGANHCEKNLLIKAETWIYLPVASSMPCPAISVKKTLKKNKRSYCLQLPVVCRSVNREIVSSASDKVMWGVRILSRNTDVLTTSFSDVISQNGDISKLEVRLKKLQDRMSQTTVFGPGISKHLRSSIMDYIKEIQKKIDLMHGMLARFSRGDTQSVAMLARAHDLRYEAQFSKSRRQRLMDKRVVKNMRSAKTDQSKLQSLHVDQTELGRLSRDSLEFFFCVLSQLSVKDVLLDTDDTGDAIGFGLAVKRPEHALDEPTATRIFVISGTLVSRNALFDALEYKISVAGQLSAHGGFDFKNPLGYATVGMSREPINAWLPLYITRSHWERVKVLLKPTLGYFCTLDPLGYDYKQMDVLFMVLGNMIGQLGGTTVGEHQLRLLFAFQKTCAATICDFELLKPVTEAVKNFIDSPEGRTKDVIPNLSTLIGYLAALPVGSTRQLLGYDGWYLHGLFFLIVKHIFVSEHKSEKLPQKAVKFWISFLAECLRRAGGSAFREVSDNLLNGIIDRLLNGQLQDKLQPAITHCEARLVQECRCLKDKKINMQVKEFDPTLGVKAPDVKLERLPKVDRAMDIWAQAQCGFITNKNRTEQVKEAKKVIDKWMAQGVQMAAVNVLQDEDVVGGKEEQTGETTGDTIDVSYCTASVLETTAQLLEKLSRLCFPELSTIPGFIAFIDCYLRNGNSFVELDENGGIAPESWVSQMKEAVHKICTSMQGFESRCSELTGMKSETSETLVVIAGESDIQAAADISNNSTGTGRGSGAVTQTSQDDAKSMMPSNEDNTSPVQDDHVSDFSDYEDSEDEESPERIIQKRKKTNQTYVSLPMILHCIRPEEDNSVLIRAMLCQAVEFHSNSRARAGAKSGNLKDLAMTEHAAETLVDFHSVLKKRRDTAFQSIVDEALWQRANHCMLYTDTIWAFIGYLMSTHKDRGEGFSQLMTMFFSCEKTELVPLIEEKLKVLLMGKYKDCSVLANGNMWLPEKKVAKKFEDLIGEEVWTSIHVELRSNIQVHVYRESDISNRHGHCNSNPYIPNVLRAKLGMPLLPEPKQKQRKVQAAASCMKNILTQPSTDWTV
ncbi:uncharacterized protein LOC121381616 [Gigantopelta aegis]|uniref:uncharacterized protein LOC121381616 n=1 Tax=Gigantopelta aegis TaxID=1735272 RepID=UPI001B88A5C9|nr:uncharacterized protein LOC121381616 [Gigantopelta aegis]